MFNKYRGMEGRIRRKRSNIKRRKKSRNGRNWSRVEERSIIMGIRYGSIKISMFDGESC